MCMNKGRVDNDQTVDRITYIQQIHLYTQGITIIYHPIFCCTNVLILNKLTMIYRPWWNETFFYYSLFTFYICVISLVLPWDCNIYFFILYFSLQLALSFMFSSSTYVLLSVLLFFLFLFIFFRFFLLLFLLFLPNTFPSFIFIFIFFYSVPLFFPLYFTLSSSTFSSFFCFFISLFDSPLQMDIRVN